MNYLTPEERQRAKELNYHLRCMEQYTESAIKLAPYPRMQQRVMDNAEFHRVKFNRLNAEVFQAA